VFLDISRDLSKFNFCKLYTKCTRKNKGDLRQDRYQRGTFPRQKVQRQENVNNNICVSSVYVKMAKGDNIFIKIDISKSFDAFS